MIRLFAAFCLCFAVAAQAQIAPIPSDDDPRMQTVIYTPGPPIRLVTFPDASLKLMFHRGELVERVVLSDGDAFKAAVVGSGDTVEISPVRAGAAATMHVATGRRQYEFDIETGEGLAAAYLVRLVPAENEVPVAASAPAHDAIIRTYKLSGDRSLRPDSIIDDGQRTFIEWDDGKALPAVFGIGPSGKEEIVAGHMRDGFFVIDRVYPALMFRMDKEKAQAKRRNERN